jgi:hypothetical protein
MPAHPGFRILHSVFFSFAALAVALLTGCQSASYDVRVKAGATAEVKPGGTYRLIGPTAGAPGTAEQKNYDRAAVYVRRALDHKGLREAGTAEQPTWRIEVSCGVSQTDRQRVEEQMPVYLIVPGRTYTETVQTGTSASGTPIYSTVTRQDPPTQQLVGYQPTVRYIEMYIKHLQLRAFAGAKAGQKEERAAWVVEASYRDDSRSLSPVLPSLATASVIFAGKNIEGRETIRLAGGDTDVAAVRQGK